MIFLVKSIHPSHPSYGETVGEIDITALTPSKELCLDLLDGQNILRELGAAMVSSGRASSFFGDEGGRDSRDRGEIRPHELSITYGEWEVFADGLVTKPVKSIRLWIRGGEGETTPFIDIVPKKGGVRRPENL